MSKQPVHAVVGTGTAPSAAILEALRDAINEGDHINLMWLGAPVEGSATDVVYDYVLDNDTEFTMFYAEGTTPPRLFRESDVGIVQKVRNPLKSAVEGVANKGKILFLWDEDEDDNQIDPVFDFKPSGALVLELTNGLAPIEINEDIPDPQEPSVEKDPDEVEDDTHFTKGELEIMAAPAVKRYGARLGCKAVTKAGIIAELFPEDEEEDEDGEVVESVKAAPDTFVEDVTDGGMPEPSSYNFEEDLAAVLGALSTLLTNMHKGRY